MNYWATATDVGLIQDQDLILQNITSQLDSAKTDIGIGDLTSVALQGLVTTLTNQQASHSADVASLQSRVSFRILPFQKRVYSSRQTILMFFSCFWHCKC